MAWAGLGPGLANSLRLRAHLRALRASTVPRLTQHSACLAGPRPSRLRRAAIAVPAAGKLAAKTQRRSHEQQYCTAQPALRMRLVQADIGIALGAIDHQHPQLGRPVGFSRACSSNRHLPAGRVLVQCGGKGIGQQGAAQAARAPGARAAAAVVVRRCAAAPTMASNCASSGPGAPRRLGTPSGAPASTLRPLRPCRKGKGVHG